METGNPLGLLASQMQALVFGNNQFASPTTGQTVVMTDDNTTGTLIITPASTLATLTVTLPSDANSQIGQERTIFCNKTVTLLTVNGAGTIFGAITATSPGDCVTYKKMIANTWARKI